MPGFDGTGPRGMGPMTGGGRGFCRPRGRGYGYRRYGAGMAFPGAAPEVAPLTREQYLHIDRASQMSLELIRNQRTRDKKDSLFSVLDFTRTPMGSRKLRQWILRPLTVCREIYLRQEGLGGLFLEE